MSGLPERVIVGPYTYRVERTYKEQNHGFIDFLQQRITLDQDMTIEKQRIALWHEVTHACHEIAGVCDADTEERTVTAGAPLQVQVLRDNPALVAFLTADDTDAQNPPTQPTAAPEAS